MPDVFAGRRRVPRPENDPNLSYAPGTPARAELKARLNQMARGDRRHPDHHRRQGDPDRRDREGRDAAQARPRARQFPQGDRRARPSGRRGGGQGPQRMVELVVRRSRRRVPSRRRAPDDDLAIDRRRRDDARPVEDRVPGRDRCRIGARRLLAIQRRVCAGTVCRSSPTARTPSGTRWNTARSKASSTRCRRSTSPRSAATSPARRR